MNSVIRMHTVCARAFGPGKSYRYSIYLSWGQFDSNWHIREMCISWSHKCRRKVRRIEFNLNASHTEPMAFVADRGRFNYKFNERNTEKIIGRISHLQMNLHTCINKPAVKLFFLYILITSCSHLLCLS